MRYKTTIHIISDAKDRNEAVEMAEEYLSGHLAFGIDMKCSTKPAYRSTVKVVGAVAVSALVLLAVLILPQSRHATGMIPAAAGASAIQPPLKTSSADRLSADFKKEWQVRQTAEALNAIRQ